MHLVLRRWLAPSLLVAVGLVILFSNAAPRIGDGARSIRQAHHAMHDESVILERTWAMVQRRDLHHKIGVYPGVYPYTIGAVRLLAGEDASAKTTIRATRWVSMAAMMAAMIASFVLFGLLSGNPWVGAIFTFFMAIHPEIALWACRVHPDAFALLFTNVSLACLGFAVETERPRHLMLATLFAGLSAATKLHGVFIMPVIAAWIAWHHRADRKKVLREWARHAGIFALVFVLTNPDLLKYPRGIFNGFMSIQDDNVASSGSALDWWPVMVGPGGLGWAGMLVAVFGLVMVAVRRRLDGPAIIAAFALVYLAFLVPTIHMVEARYAFPAMWPLLFVGLSALVPKFSSERLKQVGLGLAIAVFVFVDRPKQEESLQNFATFFERSLTPAKLEVGQRLRELQKTNPGLVVTSPYVYVPEGIKWTFVWSFEDIPFPDDAATIVVDHSLRTARTGANYEALVSGKRGFVVTATIANDFVIFQRRDR